MTMLCLYLCHNQQVMSLVCVLFIVLFHVLVCSRHCCSLELPQPSNASQDGPKRDLPNFSKLNDSNYHKWSIQMKAYLQMQELWQYVEIENVVVAENHDVVPREAADKGVIVGEGAEAAQDAQQAAAATAAAAAFEKGDTIARSILVLSISDDLIEEIDQFRSAAQLWKYLKTQYCSNEPYNKIYLMRKMMNTIAGDVKDLSEYIRDKQKYRKRLLDCGYKVDDMMMCFSLIEGLPKEMHTVKTLLENDKNISLNRVLKVLKSQSFKVKDKSKSKRSRNDVEFDDSDDDQDIALYTNSYNNNNNYNNNNGDSSRYGKRRRLSRDREDKVTYRTCPFCKKRGNNYSMHRPVDCYSNPKRKKKKSEQANAVVTEPSNASSDNMNVDYSFVSFEDMSKLDTSGYVNRNGNKLLDSQYSRSEFNTEYAMYSGNDSNHASTTNYNPSWIVDSGATSHMTGNRALLSKLRTLKDTVRVVFSNHSSGTGVARGIVELKSREGHTLKLLDVLYVPELRVNLVSVKSMERCGFIIVFGNDQHGIYRKVNSRTNSLKLVCSISLIGKLYTLNLEDISNSMYEMCNHSQEYLWHCRLGHVSIHALKKMKKKSLLLLPELSDSLPHCKACIQSKLTVKPFAKKKLNPAKQILHRIHSDVCGPLPLSIGKSKYFVTFIDEYSRKAWVFPMKKKSHVTKLFMDWCRRQQRQTGEVVHFLFTDNGGEYMNGELKEFCNQEGIEHDSSIPYNKQSNGLAERFNRTIVEKAHSMLIHAMLPNKFWAEAVVYATKIYNVVPHSFHKDVPSLRYNSDTLIDYAKFRIFGTECYFHVAKPKRKKLDAKGKPGIFVGLDGHNFRVYDLDKRRVVRVRSININENGFLAPNYWKSSLKDYNPFAKLLEREDDDQFVDLNAIPDVRFDTSEHNHNHEENKLDQDNNLLHHNNASDNPMEHAHIEADVSDQPDHMALDDMLDNLYDDDSTSHSDGTIGSYHMNLDANPSESTANNSGDDSCVQIEPAIPLDSSNEGSDNDLCLRIEPSIPSSRWDADLPALSQHEFYPAGRAHGQSEIDSSESEHSYITEEELAYFSQEPITLPYAFSDPGWKQAIQSEYNSLVSNNTWELAELPPGRKAIRCKWVFKIKRNADGSVARLKARLVAQGYSQKHGIDYKETFSPVVRRESIRIVLALSVSLGLHLQQMDVDTAFLNSDLDQEIYMFQPRGFVSSTHPQKVCKLKKAIYGLKQSPRLWNKNLDSFLRRIGFQSLFTDSCIYTRMDAEGIIDGLIAVYVDDLVIGMKSLSLMTKVKSALSTHYKMKDLGSLDWFLGIEITRTCQSISLTQRTFSAELLRKWRMTECNEVSTPSTTSDGLESDHDLPLTSVSVKQYRSLIGALMYLSVNTRPDLAYTVSALAQHVNNPGEIHWSCAKKVLRYLKGTLNYGITYTKAGECTHESLLDDINLHGYADASYANNKKDRKSRSAYIFFLNSGPITWCSRRQRCVALSTCEAELIALNEASKELVWIRRLIKEITGYKTLQPTVVYEDNQGTIEMVKNPRYHGRAKHIDVRNFYVREIVDQHKITVAHMASKKMVADVLTKSLDATLFIPHRDRLVSQL